MNMGLTIGTLGPHGTSSENAAYHYINILDDSNLTNKVVLYPSFEDTLKGLISGDVHQCVIPNAYQYINRFYINANTELVRTFIQKTPDYVLVKRKHTALKLNKPISVASHPAPAHLIEDADCLPNKEVITSLEADSTADALSKLIEGECDLAITNLSSVKSHECEIEIIKDFGPINMVWSVFRKH